MLEKYNRQENKESLIEKNISNICGYNIEILSPFSFDTTKMDFISSDIPDTFIYNRKDIENLEKSRGSVSFIESKENNFSWDEINKELVIFGESKNYKSGKALIYAAAQVAEHLRQLDKQVTTHGAAVEFPNGKSVIIMGNSGEGKTSAAIALCKKYQTKLIGNDQVVCDIKDGLKLVGGTKDIMLRKVATKNNLPELSYLFENDQNSWKSKVKIKPESLSINTSTNISDVSAIVWIHIDADKKEQTQIRKINDSDVIESLNISEKFSRQISGVQCPLIDDSHKLQSLGISLDNEITRKNRLEILNVFRKTGIFYLFGSDINETVDAIKHLSEYNQQKQND